MRRFEPVRAVGLLPLHRDAGRPAAQSVLQQLAAVQIADDEGRVRGRGPSRVVPLRTAGRKRSHIDDHPVTADRHLHRQCASMRGAVDIGWRRCTGVDDHHGPARLHTLEPAFRQR